jgi:hypothetical protein
MLKPEVMKKLLKMQESFLVSASLLQAAQSSFRKN